MKFIATSMERLAQYLETQGDETPLDDEQRAFYAAADIVRNTTIVPEEQLTLAHMQRAARGNRTIGGFIG